jgi:RNA-directed DNA polymerase
MEALYKLALDPVAETLADPNSYGFRDKRSTADAIAQCFIALAKGYSAPWVLDADIRACFDRLGHMWLLRHILMDTQMLHKWLTAGYIEADVFHATEEGTPQGGIASPVLANMALDGLEAAVYRAARRRGAKVNVIRYADDGAPRARRRPKGRRSASRSNRCGEAPRNRRAGAGSTPPPAAVVTSHGGERRRKRPGENQGR